MRAMRGKTFASVLAACGLAASWTALQLADATRHAAEAARKPNILFIILDDVGVDQLKLYGFGGALPARLPNLARIANRGVKFTNVWGMPECSPSRAAYFTGRYPMRTGVTSAIVDNHLPQEYLSQYEATLPRVLSKAGYISAMIGKYHLGNEKDSAGNCAPATRGWHSFNGNMTPGPPSIDLTAGGADPSGGQLCGYVQTSESGACYVQRGDTTNCRRITSANADPDTSPSRTCLQRGGLFRPNATCGENPPSAADFNKYNAYYVWPNIRVNGPRPPQWSSSKDVCQPVTRRTYMTTTQSENAAQWWNEQTGPRMLTVSYNTMHTPLQKAPTSLVADRRDFTSQCNALTPERRLLNNMLESADVEIGRMLTDMGLGTMDAAGRRLTSLNLRNTVVIIVGDNGSLGGTVRVADGFNVGRSKATVYQTGVWVPLIVAGSIVSQPGRDVDEMINAVDLFQLFGEVAGLNVNEIVPPSLQIDSKPMMSYLTSASATAVRTTNFTQVAAGKFSPDPEERSWPCQMGNLCNDTLLFSQNLCEDNGGTWFGPGGATQASSCCAIAAADSSVSINPVAQWAVRNKFYKLVRQSQTNCQAPLPPNATNKPFPWAEYETKTTVEFYDITPTPENPIGMDNAENNLLKDCAEGQNPRTCLPRPLRPVFGQLSRELDRQLASGEPQSVCLSKGDGNRDLRVNNADIRAWRQYQGKGPSQYDINMDGQTDEADLAIIQANIGTDCMNLCERADLDRNRRVNARDMTLLVQQSGTCDEVLCSGDLDGNGVVDNRDVSLMQQAQSTCGSSSAAVSNPPNICGPSGSNSQNTCGPSSAAVPD